MISIEKAEELIEKSFIEFTEELVSLNQLLGRTLSRPIAAKRAQPPFDRVAMDGIAIKFESEKKREFDIIGIQRAGRPSLELADPAFAIEVMTGAVLPRGTSTVIPYEKIDIQEKKAKIHSDYSIIDKKNIHFYESDFKKEEVLLEAGVRLTSASVALIAGLGYKEAYVKCLPSIGIISTGDELVEPGLECEDWQIFKSNPFGIFSELKSFGYSQEKVKILHLGDDEKEMEEELKKLLEDFKILILSGGISAGKFDFVEKVLAKLKVEKIFHKIKQKPGKPMYFGVGEKGQNIFALPGNPVAALICFRRYVIEAFLKRMRGVILGEVAILNEDIKYKKDFTYFMAVKTFRDNEGRLIAKPVASNGSGDFYALALSDGFIELPSDGETFSKGESFPFFPWLF